MSKLRHYLGLMLVVTSLGLLGACSDDMDDPGAAPGADAGAGGAGGQAAPGMD